jgi:hypothetical protein
MRATVFGAQLDERRRVELFHPAMVKLDHGLF